MSTKATHSTLRITKAESGEVVADKACLASTFWQRTKGLLGRSSLAEGEALILPSCKMVHMFFMRFPIDVVFCSEENVVLAVQEGLRPWQMSKHVAGARSVIELPVGSIGSRSLSPGVVLRW